MLCPFRDKYGMSEEFLRTGHGKMYVGKPYELSEEHLTFLNENSNILSLGKRNELERLRRKINELEDKITMLEKMIETKDQLIDAQKQIIISLKDVNPGR